MSKIKELFRQKVPFGVIQYFESFKASKKETVKKYELIYIKDNSIRYKELDFEDVSFLKSKPNEIKLLHNTIDGNAYEYMEFKSVKEKLKIEH